jgi:hypothetical protein
MAKASDYYFNVSEDIGDGNLFVSFVPIKFWDKNKYMKDKVLPSSIDNILPSYLEEGEESIYLSDKSCSQTKQDLLNLGFKTSIEFDDFLEKKYNNDLHNTDN